MNAAETLLSDIETFSASVGIAASTLCRKAINDGKLPKRLRAGGQVTIETAERLRHFMKDYPLSDRIRTAS